MEFKVLEKFVGKEVKLTKKGSKRSNSMVDVGQFEVGEMSIYTYRATDKLPAQYGVAVEGPGWSNYIRTSPIVKVVDETENSAVFETEGGVYLVELQ